MTFTNYSRASYSIHLVVASFSQQLHVQTVLPSHCDRRTARPAFLEAACSTSENQALPAVRPSRACPAQVVCDLNSWHPRTSWSELPCQKEPATSCVCETIVVCRPGERSIDSIGVACWVAAPARDAVHSHLLVIALGTEAEGKVSSRAVVTTALFSISRTLNGA